MQMVLTSLNASARTVHLLEMENVEGVDSATGSICDHDVWKRLVV